MTSGSNAGRELILHHDDLDGAASAAVIQFFEKKLRGFTDVVARPIRYGEDVHAVLDALGDDFARVFVLDWAPQGNGGIERLHERLGDRLVWIDHHVAAIKGYCPSDSEDAQKINGLRMSEFDGKPMAACELAWGYMLMCLAPGSPVSPPKWLETIGDWDTWRHEKIHGSLAPLFKLYFDQFGIDAMRVHVFHLLETTVDVVDGRIEVNGGQDWDILDEGVRGGATFRLFEKTQDAELMRSRAFEGTFGGIPAIMANFEHRGSARFESQYDPARHRIRVGFALDNTNVWTVSLYGGDSDIDCGALCAKWGNEGPYKLGGGHRGVGGFQTDWAHLSTLIQRADGKPVC